MLYCNRASAYKLKGKFQLMLDDSQQAIELDDEYFKAYLRNGEACLELGKNQHQTTTDMMEKGIKRIMKAIRLLEHMNESNSLYSNRGALLK